MNRERGTTIVMVTHSPEAARRGNVRVHIDDGRIVEHEDSVEDEPVLRSLGFTARVPDAPARSATQRPGTVTMR